ncbi:zinc metallopeptidase [Marinomonas sp. C2222]|uniref:Zinc metallopeptidase n=1 Tax=Marinomonas sargassi TaxID=2984494 RepID=A0ABT2YVN0_9GAMM|nr:zinc metallopeptidase [Marinomonas sargassi]MCV2403950.1 zinc metallopeptidase [Marinomonas sargassi]
MLWVIVIIMALVLIVGPNIWVRWTLKRYSQERKDLAGTGGQLAEHLAKRFELKNVTIERTVEGQDHFDFIAHAVRLSPSVFDGRSLTAVAVSAHEVGHAIAHEKKEPISRLSTRYLPLARVLQRITGCMLIGWPLISVLMHIPYTAQLHAMLVVISAFVAVLIQLAMLPEEWDASFNKALPILAEGNYVSHSELPVIKRILIACAMTYVASALIKVLYFWRWFRR